MKSYKAYLSQGQDSGCDYTIGCGLCIIDIDAEDISSATKKLENIIAEEYSDFEHRLESVELYELYKIVTYNVKELYKNIDNKEILDNLKEQNEKEYQEYLRLNNKFGK